MAAALPSVCPSPVPADSSRCSRAGYVLYDLPIHLADTRAHPPKPVRAVLPRHLHTARLSLAESVGPDQAGNTLAHTEWQIAVGRREVGFPSERQGIVRQRAHCRAEAGSAVSEMRWTQAREGASLLGVQTMRIADGPSLSLD